MNATLKSFIENEGVDDVVLGKLLMHSGWRGEDKVVDFNTGAVTFSWRRGVILVGVDFPEPAEVDLDYAQFREVVVSYVCSLRPPIDP